MRGEAAGVVLAWYEAFPRVENRQMERMITSDCLQTASAEMVLRNYC